MEVRWGRKWYWAPAAGLMVVIAALSLSSCSLFESKIHPPAPRTVELPPSVEPETPFQPYCKINYDCPLSAVSDPKVYVFKGDRRLLLVNGDTLVRDYRVGLGPHPSGDKMFIGDGRTPEGDFFICVKNAGSKYYKSLGLSYPSPKRAEDALVCGQINIGEFQKIVQANVSKTLPPANTKLGGAIFIHGGGAHKDWTLGCIAVYNSAMDELFQAVSVGTPVHILP